MLTLLPSDAVQTPTTRLIDEHARQLVRIAELEAGMRTLADTVARVGYDGRLLPSEKRIAFQCAQHVRDAIAKLNIATKD
jgi:hypothetical protein